MVSEVKIDIWEEIKFTVITTDIPYSQLAKTYNVSYQAIANRACKERWGEKKKNLKENQSLIIEQKKFQHQLRSKPQFDSAIVSTCETVIKMINKQMQDHAKAVGILNAFKDFDEHPDFDELHLLSMKQIQNRLSLTKDALDIMYRVWDVPLPKQRIEDVTEDDLASKIENDLDDVTEELVKECGQYVNINTDETPGDNGN